MQIKFFATFLKIQARESLTASNQLLKNTEKEQKRNVLTNKSIIIIASRLGTKNQSLKAGQIKELIKDV